MTEYRSIWKYLFRTPHRLDWLDAGGVRTRYLEAGAADAPPLVLLHGTAGSLENFCANIAAYAEHFHVYAIDMIGCGFTDKPDYPYTAKICASHVRDFMTAAGVRSAAFVGVSLGSWIAARLAIDFPGSVERIVAVAPAGVIPDQAVFDAYVDGLRKRRTGAAAAPSWESIVTVFRNLVLNAVDIIDDLVAVRLEIYSNPALARAMPYLLATTSGDESLTEAEWRRFPCPILTVFAKDKVDMFQSHAVRIAELAPEGRMITLGGCDHWAQFEQADLFNEFSLRFLHGEPVGERLAEHLGATA